MCRGERASSRGWATLPLAARRVLAVLATSAVLAHPDKL